MPKRIIDGEGIWKSDKIAQVEPPRYRAEYANLLALAMANGTFECNPRAIWASCYGYNRPDIFPEDVIAILDEFERVKLLFRWDVAGKVWGFWVGIDKPGRLPSPARQKERHEKTGEVVPQEKLREFLGELIGNQPETVGMPIGSLGSGLGFGLGIGKGNGSGFGSGLGEKSKAPPKNGNLNPSGRKKEEGQDRRKLSEELTRYCEAKKRNGDEIDQDRALEVCSSKVGVPYERAKWLLESE
jgi:hypothetical protein